VICLTWLFVFILCTLGIALFIDWRRKKHNNNPYIKTNPNAKPGESSNYMMGDNRYTNGEG
jgi:hypothetical protein